MNAVANLAFLINPDIKRVHDSLITQHNSLSNRLATTTSIEDAEAIVREMQEVNFRVMMTGSLLFHQTSLAIDGQLTTVIAASDALSAAITSANRVRDVIRATSKFLSLVDRVIDRIKLL